jgi:peptide/nickel transport system permease protein
LGFYAVAAWVAVTINFLIPRALPGTPSRRCWRSIPQLTASAVKALDLQFGIGHQGSLLHQYGVYLDHLIHGNLGVSTAAYPASGHERAREHDPLDARAGRHRDDHQLRPRHAARHPRRLAARRRFDQLLPAFTFLQATPYFFLALIAIQLFSNDWHIFPATGGPRWASRSASTLAVHRQRDPPRHPAGATR